MAIFSSQSPCAFALGILGNVVSFVVFLAPGIWRKKSTEGFQSLPYIAALFSASMWIYYAFLKSSSDFLLITINSLGCLIESFYLLLYVVFAPKHARMFTLKLLLLLNIGGLCSILLLSHFVLANGLTRVRVLGCICVAVSVCVFAAPLSAMRTVVRTKSVEFMPLSLSFSLTVNAVIWLVYGILIKDFFVALPNSVGIILGAVQMVLYVMCNRKWNPPRITEQLKLPQLAPSSVVVPKPDGGYDDQPTEPEPEPELINDRDDNICSRTDDPMIIIIGILAPVSADDDDTPGDKIIRDKEKGYKCDQASNEGQQAVAVVEK
ncbi:hypothetical protein CDL15_Pgr014915 [Punica granatum]|uniref:Bidirectional sugar transporter SWEET n=1 Tax=Punica granatum TaxID=22663 RepID=A0A218Y250_PUNGR|nr:hypothetical protein CDL15_Pgr014915 [Punica granatum]